MVPSRESAGKSAGLAIVLSAVSAGLWIGWPQQAYARNRQPSPFAGQYSPAEFGYCGITVADSGQLSGSLDFYSDISGSISATGVMKIKVVTTWVSFDPTSGKKFYKFSYTATGLGVLDEYGNLYGVLDWDWGASTQFFWPRCD